MTLLFPCHRNRLFFSAIPLLLVFCDLSSFLLLLFCTFLFHIPLLYFLLVVVVVSFLTSLFFSFFKKEIWAVHPETRYYAFLAQESRQMKRVYKDMNGLPDWKKVFKEPTSLLSCFLVEVLFCFCPCLSAMYRPVVLFTVSPFVHFLVY